MTEFRFKKNQGDRYVRVLDEAGATDQEYARFVQLAKRSKLGAFVAINHIEDGEPVGETIDRCAEVARRREERS